MAVLKMFDVKQGLQYKLPNVEPRFYCPKAFLTLDSHCRMDVSVKFQTSQYCKELTGMHMTDYAGDTRLDMHVPSSS